MHQDIAFVQDGQVMSFVRHGEKDSDNLYIVCNFGLKDVRNFKLSVEKQENTKRFSPVIMLNLAEREIIIKDIRLKRMEL